MDRDTTFLWALVMLAAAALAVGVSGWWLFVRDRRAWKAEPAADHPAEQPQAAGES
jgi:hypothetical protein